MFKKEAMLQLKSWCSSFLFVTFYIFALRHVFCVIYQGFTSLWSSFSHETIWCLYFFSRYTAKFDKVELEKIVENVSELPDPMVY